MARCFSKEGIGSFIYLQQCSTLFFYSTGSSKAAQAVWESCSRSGLCHRKDALNKSQSHVLPWSTGYPSIINLPILQTVQLRHEAMTTCHDSTGKEWPRQEQQPSLASHEGTQTNRNEEGMFVFLLLCIFSLKSLLLSAVLQCTLGTCVSPPHTTLIMEQAS